MNGWRCTLWKGFSRTELDFRAAVSTLCYGFGLGKNPYGKVSFVWRTRDVYWWSFHSVPRTAVLRTHELDGLGWEDVVRCGGGPRAWNDGQGDSDIVSITWGKP